ncbi:TonB-dependent receptor [Marivirga tractuosa]|uniref:TonB-dependent receptor plug n=1 Tax=Marivirga tractuosa (strain ATCC 23168 / DSM 4126 / NBRC 15989 / NCIMB 1408 / VKM B-1430 / H-43) TaxID=643867 RepID=E4TU42_MARTH|nr:outer membrane beta-barrel family protein [Marivirga tractuosa]ADR23064.1 TonB-dependent receptor plug [Marivirga tractuosa DSM 4126]BDD16262.1 TonB-dependent receptor [Marivirga tractuosa]
MQTLKNMETILALFTLTLFLTSFAQAQNGMIKGELKDNQNAPLPYSNVAVYQSSDSSLLTGSITDAEGKFKINVKYGDYYLKISAVGFRTYLSKSITVNSNNPTVDFNTIKLQEDIQVMDAVEVQALRPQVIVEADKMVVSVEGTAMAAGTSAFEVLEKSPGVFIDQDGNIQLNGRQGVQIMIDGRRSYLSATDLQNMLQGMSADNIKNIEIINNPSAKYDAEGNAGIINITLKKNNIQGINGNVNAGYRYNEVHNYNAGVQLNHKKGDWNSFLNADFSQRGRIRDADFYREINQTDGTKTIFDQDAKEVVLRQVPAIRIGTDYDINEMQSIGVMFNLYGQDREGDFDINSDLNQSGVDQYVESANNMSTRFMNTQGNFHYTQKLDTNGTKYSLDFNVVKLFNTGGATFTNSYYVAGTEEPTSVEMLENNNPYKYDIYSGQFDYEGKLWGQKIESGLKASQVTSDNDLEFYIVEGSDKSLDDNRSNHFIYTEQIMAAYTSFSGQLSEKVSYKAGLRAEQTFSLGKSLTLDTETERNYFNLFPSFFLQHNVGKNYQVNYNYSRRIDRPNYDNLNPFILYLDPYTWAQGNPYLKPQMTHSMSITQTFMRQFNLVLNYGYTTDFIAEIPLQNPEDGTTVFKQSNLESQENYSATAVIPFQPAKWWSINGNVTVFYQDFTTEVFNNRVENEATSAMVRANNTFMLPKDFRVELNGDYRSNTVWGVYEIKAQWGLDFGIKKSFMDKKLEASVNFNDVFRTRRFQGSANINGNVNELSQYFGQQSVGFSLRYRFSKGEEFKARQRNTNLEELNRAGG